MEIKESARGITGSGLAPWACRPSIVYESFVRQLGVRIAGAAHEKIEAPRVKIMAMPEGCMYSPVTSYQSHEAPNP